MQEWVQRMREWVARAAEEGEDQREARQQSEDQCKGRVQRIEDTRTGTPVQQRMAREQVQRMAAQVGI